MNEVELPPKEYLFNEEKELALVVRDESGQSLSSSSATLTVYDSSGAVVPGLNAVSMSASGTTRRRLWYLLTTGAGGSITSPGDYTAIVRMSIGSTRRSWRIPLVVKPVP